jgi:hAT family C-terminal dimerisation region
MSVECERVFSSTKKLITPERNYLIEEIIEASECLKNWWDRRLIQRLEKEKVSTTGQAESGL